MNRLLHKFAQFAVWLTRKFCSCSKCEGWRRAEAHIKKYPVVVADDEFKFVLRQAEIDKYTILKSEEE